ncbi:hypothetical protein CBO05C_2215 [Clostridium botulinum B str. Osaka05]|uniref:Uncharacterized protein n=1 Tax=Clostridium botulinum B str. Osaka05 TaxID=1407017 RepID=A0A0S6U2F3_CLOBO|nr:hypothetical protein CBO05C_2215 [Clostridium botulinum B str. Osaka05]
MDIYACQVQIYSRDQKGYVKIDLILSPENKKHLTNLFLCLLGVFYIKIKFILRYALLFVYLWLFQPLYKMNYD